MTRMYETEHQRAEDKSLWDEARERAKKGEKYKLRSHADIVRNPQDDIERQFSANVTRSQADYLKSQYTKDELRKIVDILHSELEPRVTNDDSTQ